MLARTERRPRERRGVRKSMLLAMVSALALWAGADAAGAAQLSFKRGTGIYTGVYTFRTMPGEQSKVWVSASSRAGYIRFRDATPIKFMGEQIEFNDGSFLCTRPTGADYLDCKASPHGSPAVIEVELGAGHDFFDVSESIPSQPYWRIQGGAGNDDLRGGPSDSRILGGEGDDTIRGGSGDDDLRGGPGADSLDGGPDNDTLLGEEGVERQLAGGGGWYDELSYTDSRSSGVVLVLHGDGTVRGAADGLELFSTSGFERIEGSDNDDLLAVADSAGGVVEGAEGADQLVGGPGPDILSGEGGADVIDPRGGNDWARGDAGADEIETRDGQEDKIDCGDAVDTVRIDTEDKGLYWKLEESCESVLKAPETVVTSWPGSTTHDATPAFEFTSSEPAATFECRFDSQAFAPCESPFAPDEENALPEGQHSFQVRARTADDFDRSPATRTFTVGPGPAPDPDTDGDGVPDADDTFPSDANESIDSDGDGIGNNADGDDDGDTVADIDDAFPLDKDESRDTDADGRGENDDPDDDNDGVPDADDAYPLDSDEHVDTDDDGFGDNADTDDDDDTVADADDAFPLDMSESVDTDGDGVGNNADTDDDNDAVADADDAFPLNAHERADFDGDDIGDNADADDDDDTVPDASDAFPLNVNESVDTDDDGVGNNADTDDDGDGAVDSADAFPLDAAETADTDRDGIGDNADANDDGDDHPDDRDACPLEPGEAHNGCPMPTKAEQCLRGGWTTYGTTFKNQGSCMRYVHSRNP